MPPNPEISRPDEVEHGLTAQDSAVSNWAREVWSSGTKWIEEHPYGSASVATIAGLGLALAARGGRSALLIKDMTALLDKEGLKETAIVLPETPLANLAKTAPKESVIDFSTARSLLDRAAAGDPGVRLVKMGEGKVMEAASVAHPHAHPPELFTYDLNGCYATAIDLQSPGGSRQVLLTHYGITSQKSFSQNIEELRTFTASGLRARAMILAPEKLTIPEEIDHSFAQAVRAIVGSQVKVVRYPLFPLQGQTDIFRTFALRVPRDINGPVRFKTWFLHGNLN